MWFHESPLKECQFQYHGKSMLALGNFQAKVASCYAAHLHLMNFAEAQPLAGPALLLSSLTLPVDAVDKMLLMITISIEVKSFNVITKVQVNQTGCANTFDNRQFFLEPYHDIQ